MCGAGKVLGVDIDAEAIASAARSWSLNEKGLADLVSMEQQDEEAEETGHFNEVPSVKFMEAPGSPTDAFRFMQAFVEDTAVPA